MTARRFYICLANDGYPEALGIRKVYRAVPDAEAGRVGMVRIVDESGEDYLYPAEWFAEVELPASVIRSLAI